MCASLASFFFLVVQWFFTFFLSFILALPVITYAQTYFSEQKNLLRLTYHLLLVVCFFLFVCFVFRFSSFPSFLIIFRFANICLRKPNHANNNHTQKKSFYKIARLLRCVFMGSNVADCRRKKSKCVNLHISCLKTLPWPLLKWKYDLSTTTYLLAKE